MNKHFNVFVAHEAIMSKDINESCAMCQGCVILDLQPWHISGFLNIGIQKIGDILVTNF